MSQPSFAIEDYMLIGDLRSSALISPHGSIDWLCLPYFDSPSIFGRLLDDNGGGFSIDSSGFNSVAGRYVPETAITETSLEADNCTIMLRDFMVPLDIFSLKSERFLVRSVSCQRGQASLRFLFDPKTEYGTGQNNWRQVEDRLELKLDDGLISLSLPRGARLNQLNSGYEILLELSEGQERQLILSYRPSDCQSADRPADLQKFTASFWHSWVSGGNFVDFCRSGLIRSAITLKLMQFAPTGAIVAAPTTSLPEEIGGVRNWDYRYIWIRDATFTLYALHVLGYSAEAERFFEFIHGIIDKRADGDFDVSLMYTIFGEPVPDETTLEHLTGYKDSRPVRLGNGAAKQSQLDVYGSLIDALYFAHKRGISRELRPRVHKLVMNLIHKIEQAWDQPDSGIWEVRSGVQQFSYSKVMCWVGADRAMRLSEPLGLSSDELALCQRLESQTKDWLWQNCYDETTQNFLQFPGSSSVDATNLLFVLLQFLDKHDPKTAQVVERTRRQLCRGEEFVYRYKATDDGLPGGEGAFVLCSFWLVSALAILEQTDDALRIFKKIESFIAPSGLIAEEIDPATRQYLGNYPQAFSHIGYIMSAYYLDKYLKRS